MPKMKTKRKEKEKKKRRKEKKQREKDTAQIRSRDLRRTGRKLYHQATWNTHSD